MSTRGGFTLVELMVVIVIVAVSLTVASLTLATALAPAVEADHWQRQLRDARRRAVEEGVLVLVAPDSAHMHGPVLFLPGGRAVGAGVEPLTGEQHQP